SRRRHTRSKRDWSSDVCSSDLPAQARCPRGACGRRAGRGGGFRVPLVFRTLLADTSPGRVRELRLVDTDPARLHTMQSILIAMSADREDAPRIVLSTDLREAVRGVDFIFSALRVGGTRGRAQDEQIAQQVGLLGQETTGFGG